LGSRIVLEQNLETFFEANDTRDPIKQIIYKAIEK
jgi:hypothetical protein